MAETLTVEPEPALRPAGRMWPLLAGVAVVVCLVVNTAMAWGARVTFTYDEIDTLLLGRVAQGMSVPHVDGAGYFPGWGVLLAPVWWFTDDPFTVFRIAIVVGLVVGAFTLWPLTRLATRFGLSTAQGLAVAAVLMTLPARSVQSAFALSERLVFLMVVLTVLAAYRLWERRTYLDGALFALATAGAFFVHARMAVLVVIAVVWLVAFALEAWKVAATSLVVLLGLSALDEWVARRWNALLVPRGFKQEGHLTDNLKHLHVDLFAHTLLGEAWEQVLASFGIVVVGVVVAFVLALPELRWLRLGPSALVLLTAAALWVASSLDWTDPSDLFNPVQKQQRLDVWLYGRYGDPLFMVLTLIGLCALVKGISGRQLRAAWVLAALVAIPSVLWLAKDVPTWGSVSPAQIGGITPFWWALPKHPFTAGLMPSLTNDNRVWIIATLVALVPLLVASFVRRRGLVVVLVLLLAGAGSLSARHIVGDFRVKRGNVPAAVGTMRDLLASHPSAGVAYDASCKTHLSVASAQRNYFMWWLLPAIVHKGWDGNQDIVIGCHGSAAGTVTGGKELDMGPFGSAWVLPPLKP